MGAVIAAWLREHVERHEHVSLPLEASDHTRVRLDGVFDLESLVRAAQRDVLLYFESIARKQGDLVWGARLREMAERGSK